jgi:hypothetical protein
MQFYFFVGAPVSDPVHRFRLHTFATNCRSTYGKMPPCW